MPAVRSVEALARRFPRRELALYRLYGKDADFRSLCDDWLEAAEACERWQAAGGAKASKAAEYRLLESEIETEILQRLEQEGSQ